MQGSLAALVARAYLDSLEQPASQVLMQTRFSHLPLKHTIPSKPASRREISVVLAFIVSARYRHFNRRKPVCALQVSLEAPALRASLEPLASLEAQVGVQAILHINESSSLSFSFRKLTTFVS
jgi:hypothetical protein